MRKFARFTSVILIIACIVSLVGCGDVKETEKDTFILTSDYYIVRSQHMESCNEIIEGMNYLAEAILSVYGVSVNYIDDWYKTSTGLVPNEYEILIGNTNRPESAEFVSDLKLDDYGYEVKSENVIVIAGDTPETTLKAVKLFCAEVLGYNSATSGADTPVSVGLARVLHHTYNDIPVTLNGVPIEDFVIAVPSMRYESYIAALDVASETAKYNGYRMPIKTYDSLSENDKNVICLGAADRSGKSKQNINSYICSILAGEDKDSGGKVISVDLYSSMIQKAAKAFSSSLNITNTKESVALSIPEDKELRSYTFTDDIPEWTLKNETEKKLADGLTYVEQYYTDKSSLPYRVYILYVDPKKFSIYMGTTNNSYDFTLDESLRKQDVVEQIKEVEKVGVFPVAAINGDFFNISGDYQPRGLTIKEGQYISGPGSRPWWAYTYDGEMIFGTPADYKEGKMNIKTSIGGSHIILKDGELYNLDLSNSLSYTAHPRTLAGVKADGTMIFAVIDGRQPRRSNGAPLANCALLMQSLGAVTAINMDGGGSSCMVIKDGDTFKTVNSPSDGALRRIYNSTLIVPIDLDT